MAVALPFFAITLFVSAFLLFLVQPMISKMILPNLGGTPQVWNTCVVFFQTALLAGYAYTHTVSTRLKLRTQFFVHGILLLIPLALLLTSSFYGRLHGWMPPPGANPIPATLLLLTLVVGFPFFVVSTSAPLLQKWFAYTGHPSARDPYFLYGASNLGSMLSLILYPIMVEPLLGLQDQSWTWTFGYILLLLFYFGCVALVLQSPPGAEHLAHEAPKEEPKVEEKPKQETGIQAKAAKTPLSSRIRKGPKPRGPAGPARTTTPGRPATPATAYHEIRSDDVTIWRRLRWIGLAAVPSSLMLGITTYISTDVSAIPLFWVLPLALYLLSFILVFSRWPVVWVGVPHTLMVVAQPIVVIFLIFLLLTHQVSPIWRSISFSILGFFLTAMVLHGELARDRPTTKHLTEFYLWMSVGGMLGGVFNAILAPWLFTWGLVELPVALALSFALRPFTSRLAPVEKPLLLVFGGIVGLVVGIIYFYGYYLMTYSMGYFLLGTLITFIGGIIYGSAFTFDYSTNGLTENWLISLFPGLGEWFDRKGRELKEQSAEPQPATTETVHSRRTLHKPAPDYYLLNYSLDIILPLLVAVLVLLVSANSSSILQGLFKVGQYTFSMQRDSAIWLARTGTALLQYGIPALFALAFSFRPLRFGLTIAVIFLASSLNEVQRENAQILRHDRSYFGVLRVLVEDGEELSTKEAEILSRNAQAAGEKSESIQAGLIPPYTYLMHGTTHHGLNYQAPKGLRRLATTYYHRKGPVGVIFERFNWFPDPSSNITFWADARLPASLVAMAANPLPLGGPLPTEVLGTYFSEPPYATIGLGTGTMASYGRPFQHVSFYEIDNHIRSFSMEEWHWPNTEAMKKKYPNLAGIHAPYFNYLHDALARGANLEIIMGDARMSMRPDIEEMRENERQEKQLWADRPISNYQVRQNYYHAIVVDAFSSDAIPVHLITEEAIQQYFQKLAEEGVLCVHTSNRHVDLVSPVSDIAAKLKLAYVVGNDLGQGQTLVNFKTRERVFIGTGDRGHFQSEYVMVARKMEYLPPPTSPADMAKFENREEGAPPLRWTVPPPPGSRVWTDDYSNMMSVFRWGFH